MQNWKCDCGCGAETTNAAGRLHHRDSGATWIQFNLSFNITAGDHVELNVDAAELGHVGAAAQKAMGRAFDDHAARVKRDRAKASDPAGR